MKNLAVLLFVFIGLNSHAFIHSYIHVIPDYEGCSGELDFSICNEYSFTYIMTYNGNPVSSNDFPLTNQCAASVNTLYFIATSDFDGQTYEFEASISFNSVSPSITYSIEPLVNPLSVIQTHQVSTSMCNGQIELIVDGGYAPITTEWFANGSPLPPPGNPYLLNNLCAGDYGYTIVDNYQYCGLGDPLMRLVTIDFFECQILTTDITCHDECDGDAYLMLVGSQNVQYTDLTHGINSNPMYLENLCEGIVNGQALHTTGTMATCSAVIMEPDLINFDMNITHATGFGIEDGTAAVSITAGNGPFVYDWTGDGGFEDLNGAASQSNLAAGNYSLTITYNNVCDTTITFTIEEPLELIITITSIENQTTEIPNGAVTFDIDGGVAPYLVEITFEGVTTEGPFEGLEAGQYILSVEDANGNFTSENFEILSMIVGLNEFSAHQIEIYPNPMNAYVKVIGDNIEAIEIVNSLGQTIVHFEEFENSNVTIDSSKLDAGIYFLHITINTGETIVRRVVKS